MNGSAPSVAHAATGTLSTGSEIYYDKTKGQYTRYRTIGGNVAYCAQPKAASPKNIAYTKRTWSSDIGAAILYFGYGGPGHSWSVSQGWCPAKDCDGNKMDWKDYYVATHILVSYQYGSDALYGAPPLLIAIGRKNIF